MLGGTERESCFPTSEALSKIRLLEPSLAFPKALYLLKSTAFQSCDTKESPQANIQERQTNCHFA